MRKSLVFKCVLLSVLSNGAAVVSAQASNLAYEISRIGGSCEEAAPQRGTAVEEQSGAPFTLGVSSAIPAGANETNLAANTKQQFNILVESAAKVSASVNTSSCDGLMAQLAQGKFLANSDTPTKVLSAGTEVFTNQPIAVSLPAAAWLFSSALFGFVMVANRRKV
ncbi:hypothetical protein [Pseudomonas sp. MYb118]|uniref:hypothetical protein n=1 Tax=Pseudomonas sp. MYb118 TaxID=1848720 RepID=UPI0034CF083F